MNQIFKNNFFLKLYILIASIFYLMIQFNPAFNWEHSESSHFNYSCLDRTQDSGLWSTVFHPCIEAWASRSRILNSLTFIFNSELRKYLFDFIPYFPTLSMTWIFSLILQPFIFFKLLRRFNADIETSVMGLVFLFFSVGHLSNHLMYYHQAKPMALFFTLLCLYTSSFVTDTSLKLKARIYSSLLLISFLFIGTQWDELFFFCYILIFLIFFRDIFRDKTSFTLISTSFLLSFSGFLISVSYIYPHFYKSFSNFDFNFWKYAIGTNQGLPNFKFANIVLNGKSMLSSHILPVIDPRMLGREPWIIYAFFLTITLVVIFRKRNFPYLKESFVTLFAYTIFQSIIVSKRGGLLIYGSLYWGNLFSLILALFFVFLLNSHTSKLSKKFFRRFFFIIITIIAASNSLSLNSLHEMENISQIKRNIDDREGRFAPWPNLTSGTLERVSWNDVINIWEVRDDFQEAKRRLHSVSDRGYWMYMHLYRQHFDYIIVNKKGWIEY